MEVIDCNHTLIINPDKSCRLCLSQSLVMQNISSSLIVDGEVVSVVDMLAYTLGITVNINNKLLPKKMCTDCQKKITHFYTFKKQTIKLEKSLISIFSPQALAESDIIQAMDDDTRSTFDSANSMNVHSEKKLVEFYICNSENDVETTVKEKEIDINDLQVTNNTTSKKSEINVNVVSNEGHDMLIANHIDENGEDQKVQLTRPMRRRAEPKSSYKKRSTSSKKPTSKKSTIKTTLKDYFANVDVNSDVDEFNGLDKELADHSKSHHIMRLIIKYSDFFPCHNCCLLFISEDKLDEHNTRAHPGIALEQTDEPCTDTFLEDFMVVKVYSCGECSKSCSTIGKLKIHILSHASKFKCPMENCGCECSGLGHLSNHVFKKHMNIKHQICFHCSQAFETYESLQLHIQNYCTAKVFECFECDRKFFSKKALGNHLKAISGKKLKCNICEKDFKNKFQLEIHTRSHTNERPFKCTICDKSYKTSSMRTIHMDSHNKEKTYDCKLCCKKLQTRATYRSHMKRHTQEKKHKCEHCGKGFFTNYHMRLHQSKVHGENVAIQPKTQDDDDYLNKIMNDSDLAKFIDDDNDDDIMQFLI